MRNGTFNSRQIISFVTRPYQDYLQMAKCGLNEEIKHFFKKGQNTDLNQFLFLSLVFLCLLSKGVYMPHHPLFRI